MTCRLRWCVEMETRCRIPIWRTFGRIQWHVIPEPPATLQGAATGRMVNGQVILKRRGRLQGTPTATWWIHCHDPRATLQGAVTWRNQCHDRATLQGVRIQYAILKIVFTIFYFFFCFLNAVWALSSGGFCIVSDTLYWWEFRPNICPVTFEN